MPNIILLPRPLQGLMQTRAFSITCHYISIAPDLLQDLHFNDMILQSEDFWRQTPLFKGAKQKVFLPLRLAS